MDWFFLLLMPGATDACIYAQAGIQVYGFTPGILPPDYPVMDLGHGHNERLPISYIRSGFAYSLEIDHTILLLKNSNHQQTSPDPSNELDRFLLILLTFLTQSLQNLKPSFIRFA